MRNLHCTVDLSYVVPVKSKVEILKMFVAFSDFMNFNGPFHFSIYVLFPFVPRHFVGISTTQEGQQTFSYDVLCFLKLNVIKISTYILFLPSGPS